MMMPTPRLPLAEAPVDVGRLYAAHTAATAWFRAQLHRSQGPMVYLRRRGLDTAVDGPWRIGFAPRAWTGLVDHLRGRGFTDSELVRGGLAFRSRHGRLLDLFRDRIMFPLRDGDGRVVGYTGRIWHPPSRHDRYEPPKYLNSPETPIYQKGHVLFGLHEQRDRTDAGYPPVIVEGPTDVLAIWTAYSRASRTGFAGLATCGTAVTANQLDLTAGLPGAFQYGLSVAFDGDAAGRKATERAYHLLAERHPGLVTRGVRWSAGTDPADLARTPEGQSQLRAGLGQAQPLLHLVIDDRIDQLLTRTPQLLHEVEGRMLLAQALLPLVAEQPAVTIAEAMGHVANTVVARIGDTSHAAAVTSGIVRCLTSAIANYLETTPPPPHSSSRPPPYGHAPTAAFPHRPSPGSPSAASAGPVVGNAHVRSFRWTR